MAVNLVDGCNCWLQLNMSLQKLVGIFISVYLHSWAGFEYQSYHKFRDLGAHQFSALFDYCTKSYGPNTTARPAEKQPGQRRRNWIFLTTLAIDFISELNTKVVDLQTFYFLLKYEKIPSNILGVTDFLVTNSISVQVVYMLIPILPFAHLLSCTWAMYTTLLMKEFADSRWWGRHTVLLVVLGMLATDRSSRHHRHPTLWNTWPPKLSYCANSSKGSSNSSSGVGTMSTNLRLPTTQTSWVLSLHCSTK